METQAVIALVVGTVVVFFAPALVWATVIAGLIQTGREKRKEKQSYPERSPLPARIGW